MPDEYHEYREDRSEAGAKYEDFILASGKLGVMWMAYRSKHYQFNVGENTAGIEIKFDDRSSETGNLYIEVAEKSCPSRQNYSASGIMRNDNSWIYLIGNYDKAWLFSKKHLVRNFKEGRGCFNQENFKESTTSQGYVMKKTNADKICVTSFTFGEEKRMESVEHDDDDIPW